MERIGTDSPGSEAGRARADGAPRPITERDDADAALLSRQLAGDLPCVACGYNLRGMSIRSVCPECSTPVRAAILAVVDPHASELQPIRWPALVGAGVVVWSTAGLIAALLLWSPSVVDLYAVLRGVRLELPEVGLAAAIFAGLSGLGALALVRPHAGLGAWRIAGALLALVMYVPLTYIVWRLGSEPDAGAVVDYLRGLESDWQRLILRVALMGLVAVIALGLRLNARVLVSRSLALRQGRVDRQTLAAVAVAAIITAGGDAAAAVAGQFGGVGGDVVRLGAVGVITIGAALVTIGLAGAAVDSWRIAAALRVPSPKLRDLVEPPAEGREEAGEERQ